MSCSFAVCQCHGTLHPDVALISRMEASFIGSPFSTANVAQDGSTGSPPNLEAAAVLTAGLASVCATERVTESTIIITTANATMQAFRKFIENITSSLKMESGR